MSSLTSRSCRTHALRSSNRLGCVSLELVLDVVQAGFVFGIGMGSEPLQYFQVSFASRANLTLRLQREYSGPEAFRSRIGTPGRCDEVDGCIVEGILSPVCATMFIDIAGRIYGRRRQK